MGAVSFSLDRRLVDALKSALPLNVLVETGTFKGDTVFTLESCFEKVVSIELSEELWADAAQRFTDYSHVRILQGNSEDKLRQLQNEFQDQGVLYWLDAHWCVGGSTAGELSQCPLLSELQTIGQLNGQSVVLIDDARLFLAPPLAPHEISQWPGFHQVVTQLLSMSPEHELMVVNDVIAFYPPSAKPTMTVYAQTFGSDFLLAMNCLRVNGNFMQQFEEKEYVIQKMDSTLRQQLAVIQEKENIIQQLAKTIQAYRMAYGGFTLLRPVARAMRRAREIVWPRIGNFHQYVPRPLTTIPAIPADPRGPFPTISIVTPSFNQGTYIERTLMSVADQAYPNLEYFVQDGGSKDNTVEVLKKQALNLSGWTSEADSGQSQAINRGFAKTSGDIMAWLNSDDLLLPGALHTVADYFNRHPDVDVVYGNRLLIDENDMEIGRWIMPGHDNAVLSWVDYVPQETMFWRRRIWDKVGGQIDESFRFAMDWDLLVRFRDVEAKFSHIPRFLGAFRIHTNQKTTALINDIGHQEMNRIRQRVLGRVPSRKEIRWKIFPYLVMHIAFDMAYRIKKLR